MSDSTGSSVEYVGRVAQQTLHDYAAKIEELTVAHDRLRKENAALREALQRAIPYIATAMVGCHGDKCREPWCYSCCGEEAARKAAQEGCDACANARAALQGAKDD